MHRLQERFCLIIPCYNEAARLDLSMLASTGDTGWYVIVNDGSTDTTSDRIREYLSDRVHLCDLALNVGKGEAIRQGVLYARQSGILERVSWAGYWDADMSTPLSEVGGFFDYAETYGIENVDGILGSRVLRLGSSIRRSLVRHLLGRVFTTLVANMTGLGCYDSQCGSKLFRTSVLDEAFAEPFLSRWIFDVEILLRLRARRIIEYPVRSWTDVGGGSLSVPRELLPTLWDLLRIWRRYRRS
jgi:dolichyl-phosphate beta-glucosyltransferase